MHSPRISARPAQFLVFAAALSCLMISGCQNRRKMDLVAKNNFKQIGLALMSYHAAHRQFPPAYTVDAAGKPLLSWRVAILPFLEQMLLYRSFKQSEPWDSPHNKALLEKMPPTYRSPYSASPTSTYVVAVVGPDTAWPAPSSSNLKAFSNPPEAVLAVEYAGDDIPWTKPTDLEAASLDYAIHEAKKGGISGFGSGAIILHMDGRVEVLDKTTKPDELKAKVNPPKQKKK